MAHVSSYAHRGPHLGILACIILLLVACDTGGSASSSPGGSPGPGGNQQPSAQTDAAGVPVELERTLAEKYAPILLFDPSEPDYPMGVDKFLTLPSPPHLAYDESCHFKDATPVAVFGPMTQDQLLHTAVTQSACDKVISQISFSSLQSTTPDPEAPRYGGEKPNETFYLTQVPNNNDRRGLDTSHWITYYHVYPTIDGGLMVQYWHFFAYNNMLSDSKVGTVKGGRGNHYGDWDASIQVQLDSSLSLEAVWFSRHTHDHPGDLFKNKASFTPGADTEAATVYLSGDHPIVMADSGSHAAFASPADYCDFQGQGIGNYTGKAVWGDPSNPGGLQQVRCSGIFAGPINTYTASLDKSPVGGTVWSTTSGGAVAQAGSVVYEVIGHQGGPLRNLGQFNPGTMASCTGTLEKCSDDNNALYRVCTVCVGISPPHDTSKPIEQWGSWFPGDAGPFTAYSGLWGSPTDHSAEYAYPPRGPVYQGFVDGRYTAWYNQASPNKWVAAATSTSPPKADLTTVDWTKAVTETDLGCNAPTGPHHGVQVDEKQFADVTGDGKKEAFVAVACVASTSSWPDRLEVFDGASDPAHPRRIATLLDYQDGTDERGLRIGSNVGIPHSITISGQTVTVVSLGYAPTDPDCCPSRQITDTFTWNGSGFTRGSRSMVQAKAP